jgi:hypothetical protein
MGTSQPDFGYSYCIDCITGRYAQLPGQDACTRCPTGRYLNESGQTTCHACEAGKYTPLEEQKQCQSCSPGYYSGSGQDLCKVCEEGTATSIYGTETCPACSDFSGPNFEHTACDCDAGYYRYDSLGVTNEVTCYECPEGADCTTTGLTYNTLPAQVGFWRQTNSSSTFYRCLRRDQCAGGAASATGSSACNGNRAGILCAHCAIGYREGAGDVCTPCPTSNGSWFILILLGLLILALVWLQLWFILFAARDLMNRANKEMVRKDVVAHEEDMLVGPVSPDPTGPPAGMSSASRKAWATPGLGGRNLSSREGNDEKKEDDTETGGTFKTTTTNTTTVVNRQQVMIEEDVDEDGNIVVHGDNNLSPSALGSNGQLDIAPVAPGLLLTPPIQARPLRAPLPPPPLPPLAPPPPMAPLNMPLSPFPGQIRTLGFPSSSAGRDHGAAPVHTNGPVFHDLPDDGEGDDSGSSDSELEGSYKESKDDVHAANTLVPDPPPNFTYKLKIFLGFIQIVTNLGTGLEIQWPATYKAFVAMFDVFNFDWILGTVLSTDCISSVTYYFRYVVIVVLPIALILLVMMFLAPRFLNCCCYKHDTHVERRVTWLKFWVLVLYCLFLIYPAVSSVVLRHYKCKLIDTEWYLLTDLRVSCYTDLWWGFAFLGIPLMVLYPAGIPLFFFYELWGNRYRLDDPGVRAKLGFLYDGYKKHFWWWEMVDMIHKLIMTSILAFFPTETQLPIGMSVAILYTMALLVCQPYVRNEDDLLHLLVQAEIFLLCAVGWVFCKSYTLSYLLLRS